MSMQRKGLKIQTICNCEDRRIPEKIPIQRKLIRKNTMNEDLPDFGLIINEM